MSVENSNLNVAGGAKRLIVNNVWNKIKSISFNYPAMMSSTSAEAAE